MTLASSSLSSSPRTDSSTERTSTTSHLAAASAAVAPVVTVYALNVGGVAIDVASSLLAALPPGNTLAAAITHGAPIASKSMPRVFLQRNPHTFRLLCDYYSSGRSLPEGLPRYMVSQLGKEARHFALCDLLAECKTLYPLRCRAWAAKAAGAVQLRADALQALAAALRAQRRTAEAERKQLRAAGLLSTLDRPDPGQPAAPNGSGRAGAGGPARTMRRPSTPRLAVPPYPRQWPAVGPTCRGGHAADAAVAFRRPTAARAAPAWPLATATQAPRAGAAAPRLDGLHAPWPRDADSHTDLPLPPGARHRRAVASHAADPLAATARGGEATVSLVPWSPNGGARGAVGPWTPDGGAGAQHGDVTLAPVTGLGLGVRLGTPWTSSAADPQVAWLPTTPRAPAVGASVSPSRVPLFRRGAAVFAPDDFGGAAVAENGVFAPVVGAGLAGGSALAPPGGHLSLAGALGPLPPSCYPSDAAPEASRTAPSWPPTGTARGGATADPSVAGFLAPLEAPDASPPYEVAYSPTQSDLALWPASGHPVPSF